MLDLLLSNWHIIVSVLAGYIGPKGFGMIFKRVKAWVVKEVQKGAVELQKLAAAEPATPAAPAPAPAVDKPAV